MSDVLHGKWVDNVFICPATNARCAGPYGNFTCEIQGCSKSGIDLAAKNARIAELEAELAGCRNACREGASAISKLREYRAHALDRISLLEGLLQEAKPFVRDGLKFGGYSEEVDIEARIDSALQTEKAHEQND